MPAFVVTLKHYVLVYAGWGDRKSGVSCIKDMIFLTASTQYLKCKQKWLIWSPWRDIGFLQQSPIDMLFFSKGKFGDFINPLRSSWLQWLNHYTRWGRASSFFWPNQTYFLPHVYTTFLGAVLWQSSDQDLWCNKLKCIQKNEGPFFTASHWWYILFCYLFQRFIFLVDNIL